MKQASIQYPSGKPLKGTIRLPGSKSISNRCLLIQALCEEHIQLHHLSESDDTKRLQALLASEEPVLDAGDSGTVMRFLTAYEAGRKGVRIITGNERMQQRPIGVLADALTQLGADIQYVSHTGFPPLRIHGKSLSGNQLKMAGDVSSQFVTAILLMAPAFTKEVFTLEIEGQAVSKPYIDMTLGLMRTFGIAADWNGELIEVFEGAYNLRNLSEGSYTVEADWSSAAFWYQAAVLADEAEIKIVGLQEKSFQGDRQAADYFGMLGVTTEFVEDGIVIRKKPNTLKQCIAEFRDIPDLAIPFMFACAGAGISTRANGLDTLRIKESDRVEAMREMLHGLGARVMAVEKNALHIEGPESPICTHPLDPHKDHRLVMAAAMCAVSGNQVQVKDPQHVSKSYPGFWNDLTSLGFQVTFEK